jgi:hypothetical protein
MSDRNRQLLIASHLARARAMLPESASSDGVVHGDTHAPDQSELKVESERLESYAECNPVPREFWMALRDAAIALGQVRRAAYFDRRAEVSTPTDDPDPSARPTASDSQYRPEKNFQSEWRLMKDVAFGLGIPVLVISSLLFVDAVMAELPRKSRAALMIVTCAVLASLLYRLLHRITHRRSRSAQG